MHIDDKIRTYENLNKEIPAETKLSFLSLVVSLIIIFVLAAPKYKEVKIAEVRAGLMEKNLELKEGVIKKIADYNEINKDLSDEDVKKFSKLLPEEDSTEDYIANIGDLAAANKIFISDFSVRKSSKQTEIATESETLKLNTAEVSLSLSGNFTDLMLFLGRLEKSVPLMNLNKLEIGKKEKKENEVRVSYGENRKDFYAVSDMPIESVMFHFDNLKNSERDTQLAGVSSDSVNWSLNVDDGYLEGDAAYNFYATGFSEEKSYISVNNVYIPENGDNGESKKGKIEESVQVEADIGFLFYYL